MASLGYMSGEKDLVGGDIAHCIPQGFIWPSRLNTLVTVTQESCFSQLRMCLRTLKRLPNSLSLSPPFFRSFSLSLSPMCFFLLHYKSNQSFSSCEDFKRYPQVPVLPRGEAVNGVRNMVLRDPEAAHRDDWQTVRLSGLWGGPSLPMFHIHEGP